MSEEKAGIHERLSAAFHSSDLSLSANKRRDADHLIALGWASQSGRADGALTRLHLSASQSDYRAARESCWRIAKQIDMKRNWRLSTQNLCRIGELALAHHVFPTCPHCSGLKFVKHEDSPHLSANICKHCSGTGKRAIQRKFHDEIRDVMEVLANIDLVTGRAVQRALR